MLKFYCQHHLFQLWKRTEAKVYSGPILICRVHRSKSLFPSWSWWIIILKVSRILPRLDCVSVVFSVLQWRCGLIRNNCHVVIDNFLNKIRKNLLSLGTYWYLRCNFNSGRKMVRGTVSAVYFFIFFCEVQFVIIKFKNKTL